MRREMIFDTAGTGFDRNAIREMMEQPEAVYLDGLKGNGLGDEIMLLEGLDDVAPHGYSDGPAMNFTLPTGDPWTDYNFQEGVDLSGLSADQLGAPVQRSGWPVASGKEDYRYTGLGRADYRYTGLGRAQWPVNPLAGAPWPVNQLAGGRPGWPTKGKPSYRYTGLDRVDYRYTGLGDAASDARTATAIANSALSLCRVPCNLLSTPTERNTCNAGCQAAYDAAVAAITAAYPVTTPGAPVTATPMDEAAIRAKLDRIAGAGTATTTPPPAAPSSGVDTNTLLIGGLVVAGLIGVALVMK